MAAYRRQTGRLRLTPRQMRQVMKMVTRERAHLLRIRDAVMAATSGHAPTEEKGQ